MSEQMHTPTPEHQSLSERAGSWKVRCEYFVGGSEPMVVEATEEKTMLGSFWLQGQFSSNMMGMPFEGRATIGFNPTTGRWVSTWIDTMTPFLFHFEGESPDGGKTMDFRGKGPHPQTGEMVDYRTHEAAQDDGSRLFEMFLGSGDQEHQIFRYTYTRA